MPIRHFSVASITTPLHRHVQSTLNQKLKSQKPFDITYSSLWGLMKDIGTKLEKHNGLFSISLYNYNADVCSLFTIGSRIRERCSDKENDDVIKDLVIAAEAYYKKISNPPDLMQLGYRLKQSGEYLGMLNTPYLRDATWKSLEQVRGASTNTSEPPPFWFNVVVVKPPLLV